MWVYSPTTSQTPQLPLTQQPLPPPSLSLSTDLVLLSFLFKNSSNRIFSQFESSSSSYYTHNNIIFITSRVQISAPDHSCFVMISLSLSLSHPITSTKLSTVSSQNPSTCWSLQLRRFVMVFEVLNGYSNNLMFFSKSSSLFLFGLSTNPRPAFAASTVQNSRHKFLDAWGKYVCMYVCIIFSGCPDII